MPKGAVGPMTVSTVIFWFVFLNYYKCVVIIKGIFNQSSFNSKKILLMVYSTPTYMPPRGTINLLSRIDVKQIKKAFILKINQVLHVTVLA